MLAAAPALRPQEVRGEIMQLQREAVPAPAKPAESVHEPVHYEPLRPEPQPVAASVPEVWIQPVALAVEVLRA